MRSQQDRDRAIALTRTVATQATPEAPTGLRHSVSVNYRKGGASVHNPRLIVTRAHKPPVAKGHRQFIGKQEWK